MQAYSCLFVMAAVFFIPESPRFLMANGKEDQAFEFLVKYHGNGDPNAALVQLEMQEWKEQISQHGPDKKWWDYRPLFDTPNHRWRALQIVMIAMFSQYCGNGLGYFNTVRHCVRAWLTSGDLRELGSHICDGATRLQPPGSMYRGHLRGLLVFVRRPCAPSAGPGIRQS